MRIKVDIYVFINHDINMRKGLDILFIKGAVVVYRMVVGFAITYAISTYHH